MFEEVVVFGKLEIRKNVNVYDTVFEDTADGWRRCRTLYDNKASRTVFRRPATPGLYLSYKNHDHRDPERGKAAAGDGDRPNGPAKAKDSLVWFVSVSPGNAIKRQIPMNFDGSQLGRAPNGMPPMPLGNLKARRTTASKQYRRLSAEEELKRLLGQKLGFLRRPRHPS